MSERFSRQRDLVPEDKLSDCKISIIGLGAIGRQVALQLAAMGTNNLQLIDFDKVEISNLASQGYLESDLEDFKVFATERACLNINKDIKIESFNNKFKRNSEMGNVIFCCVDKIQVRKFIWEALKDKVDFFVDGRMSGEVLRVITATTNNPDSMEHYPDTLFAASEAFVGACTSKSTIYCANIAAGRMVSRFALWLRGVLFEDDILLNLISDELIINTD
jgi:sulfur carrier protein ThiS adenylyltransferase